MSKIEIELDLMDENFAIMYARRLAELSPQLSITIKKAGEVVCEKIREKLTGYEDQSSCRGVYACDNPKISSESMPKVIITDKEDCLESGETIVTVLHLNSANGEDEPDGRIYDSGKFYIHSPVRQVLKYIVASYEEKTGHFIGTNIDEKMKTYGFFSLWGGCGTTAVAVTFAKHLAASKSGRILFISRDADCLTYSNCISIPIKPYAQLEYSIRQRRPFSLENYMYEDEYGLNYIISPIGEDNILREIEKTNKFQHAVVDYGKIQSKTMSHESIAEYCETIFCVAKEDDLRCEIEAADVGSFIIYNCSKICGHSRDCYLLPADSRSFYLTDQGIKIDLFGGFGSAVKKIVRDATGEKVLS